MRPSQPPTSRAHWSSNIARCCGDSPRCRLRQWNIGPQARQANLRCGEPPRATAPNPSRHARQSSTMGRADCHTHFDDGLNGHDVRDATKTPFAPTLCLTLSAERLKTVIAHVPPPTKTGNSMSGAALHQAQHHGMTVPSRIATTSAPANSFARPSGSRNQNGAALVGDDALDLALHRQFLAHLVDAPCRTATFQFQEH